MIVQELYQIQSRNGYLPRKDLEALADQLALPRYRVQEVVSFFPHYRTTPPPTIEVQVCRDMACQLRGAEKIHTALSALAGKESADRVAVRYVSCLGRCDRAPAVRICHASPATIPSHGNREPMLGSVGRPATALGSVGRPATVLGSVGSWDSAPSQHGEHGHSVHTVLSRSAEEVVGIVKDVLSKGEISQAPHDSDLSYPSVNAEAWQINVYAGLPNHERYQTIRQFIAQAASEEQRKVAADRIIQALETAGLLGMGGAGGRTYKKWSEVREAQGAEKYVVCNGDESEPATFKDRELLLRTPNLVLEGVILAGLLLGAKRGYIYIRHEYEEQIEAMEREIERACSLGVCGNNILGSGISFPVEVFVSPGGYICGEQTALIQAIEDKRAEPRNRPPELQTNGLWDMPTLLNNVETLAWVPAIVLKDDGRWYAERGASTKFKGARFFSISGDVARPGVYEVPIGIKLGELIDRYAGGMRAGQKLKAVALSGPSGGFLPAMLPLSAFPPAMKDRLPPTATDVDIRDLELDIAMFRKWNLMLGGGLVVYGHDADMVAQAQVCSEFYRQESCGKCVPCRIGSTKLVEIANALYAKQLTPDETNQLGSKTGPIVELATIMRQTAICGLGTVAANPLTTLLTYFDDEVKQYTKQK